MQKQEKLPNLYQYLEVGGKPFSRPRPDKANSKFWNEGKWETFIKPLLPDGKVFVEMGCDAGLFLKLAKDSGFERVIGVEKNKTPVRLGLEYRDTIGYDYQILKRKLGSEFHEEGTFDINELPVADVTLMSTFHYYIDINAWIKYVDMLKGKSCHVIIVSRPESTGGRWRASAEPGFVRSYFHDWDVIGLVENVPKEGDSKPRDLYSVVFKNPVIRRVSLSSVKPRTIPGAQRDLADRVASGEDFDLFDTDYYRSWRDRKSGKWSDRTLRHFVGLKANVMKDVRDNGLKEPILVDKHLRLADGGHRYSIIKALGHDSVIVRVIP